MMLDKISIITVCYNSVGTIRQTIESVLSQTYENLEYIVIDGASTDGTVDIIKEYTDRLACFVSEKDNGIYDAMNKGICYATGEWITFRNSGDLFVSESTVSDFFKKAVNPTVGIVHGDCIYTNEWGYKLMKPAVSEKEYLSNIPVLHPATFVRAYLYKNIGYDTSYKSAGDYDFICKCCKANIVFEYRPIPVSYFPIGGFAVINNRLTYKEGCKIKGLYSTYGGRVKVCFGYVMLSFKIMVLSVFNRFPILGKIRKHNLIKKGWIPYSS